MRPHSLGSLVLIALGLSLPVTASAQVIAGSLPPTTPETRDQDLLLSFRGVGEIWQDPHIAAIYRSSRFTGGVSAAWQFHRWLSADLELSYLRMMNEAGARFELVPIALDVTAYREVGRAEVFGGLGPALVPFSEDSGSFTPGTKLGLDVRGGVRIATGLYDPPAYPPSGIERVDLELFIGRRQHFGPTATQLPADLDGYVGPGRLDLSAWRVGLGLGVRL